MQTNEVSRTQGHWILAKMGKTVLRPGGKELTKKLVKALHIVPQDNIVEFAPGLGYTASLILARQPKSYTGVDADGAAIALLQSKINKPNVRFIQASAANTPIPTQSKNKVFGEAMLTMHADHRKSEIIKEAYRILVNGGTYAIHELGLQTVDESLKTTIQKDLAQAIKVNARPLTAAEWTALLEQEGFMVKEIITNPMHLLEPKRMIDDEGFLRSLKIAFNILTHAAARKRIMQMRKTFQKYQSHLHAIAIIAEKK